MNTAAARGTRTRFKLIKEIAAELRKVNWLTRREVIHLTILVLILTVVVGVILGAIDYGFSVLMRFITGG